MKDINEQKFEEDVWKNFAKNSVIINKEFVAMFNNTVNHKLANKASVFNLLLAIKIIQHNSKEILETIRKSPSYNKQIEDFVEGLIQHQIQSSINVETKQVRQNGTKEN
jgi:hypothetical protein